jgi:hypothetical protein
VIAALVQLPLRSPLDSLFNSASVTFGALAGGLAAGLLWKTVTRRGLKRVVFFALWAALYGTVALAAVAGETLLERMVTFVLPLGALVLGITGAATPLLAERAFMGRWWLPAGAVAVAIAVGLALVGMGDQPSGRLELPPRAH